MSHPSPRAQLALGNIREPIRQGAEPPDQSPHLIGGSQDVDGGGYLRESVPFVVDGQRGIESDQRLLTHLAPEVVGNGRLQRGMVFRDALGAAGARDDSRRCWI